MTVRNNTCVTTARQLRHQNFMKLLELTYEDFDYDFSKVVFDKDLDSFVRIKCPKCGWIRTKAKKLLAGRGCTTCNSGSLMDQGAMIYIIRCYDQHEEFYKIGITTKSMENRFPDRSSLPYEYDVLSLQNGDRKKLYRFENLLLKLLSKYKYKPKKEFAGQTECFSNIDLIRQKFNIFDAFGIDSFKRAV
ncbi:GIY-YIG nuclease family protein [Acinetobacter piscicola]|uniref:GIY-YIG nuclease family protein n=1 Tax=Acinetobacter piscicola TaxID=2006115 RepID=UPI00101FD0E9|nr:GIY-YIG nuclease family protein [Acinetobacter piscicola]RYL25097.1 hypothetical protein EWP19_13020 [Acinetobacter piscicola]